MLTSDNETAYRLRGEERLTLQVSSALIQVSELTFLNRVTLLTHLEQILKVSFHPESFQQIFVTLPQIFIDLQCHFAKIRSPMPRGPIPAHARRQVKKEM